MRYLYPPSPRKSQRGAAALMVSLVLLFGMTLVIFFLNRGLLFEQKTSANQFRSTSAFELADAGIEWSTGMLNDARKIGANCQPDQTQAQSFRQRFLNPGLTTSVPPLANFAVPANSVAACRITNGVLNCSCPNPGAGVVLPASADPSFSVSFAAVPTDSEAITVTSRGCVNPAADCVPGSTGGGDATATVTVTLKLKPSMRAVPAAALSVGGSAQICGSFNLANTNITSNGNLVNAGGHIEIGNTIKTGETGLDGGGGGGGACGGGGGQTLSTIPGTPLQNVLVSSDDSLKSLSSNSDAMFASYFGTTLEQYKKTAKTITGATAGARADNLRAEYAKGFRDFWIDGDIQFSGSVPLGTAQESVKLVSSSNISVNGTMDVYGIVYSDSADWQNLGTGASNIHGAVITRDNYKNNGNGSITYNSDVLFGARPLTGSMVRVPGSWRDF